MLLSCNYRWTISIVLFVICISICNYCLLNSDLSFNNIEVIEGLDKLTQLEDLTLFHNRIQHLENMDTLTKLHVLSVGNNDLKELDNVSWLLLFSLTFIMALLSFHCILMQNIHFSFFFYLNEDYSWLWNVEIAESNNSRDILLIGLTCEVERLLDPNRYIWVFCVYVLIRYFSMLAGNISQAF